MTAAALAVKGVSASELIGVVRAASAGEVYDAPGLAWSLLHEMSTPRSADLLGELSNREHRVLDLVASGRTNQEIGLRRRGQRAGPGADCPAGCGVASPARGGPFMPAEA